MAKLTTLMWDIGGVLLSNGWDVAMRNTAAERFDLDVEDFQERHARVEENFETGRLSLEQYLDYTVFYRPRAFTIAQFEDYMVAQSHQNKGVLDILERLKQSGEYLLGAINNESLELNLFRIKRFELRRYFTVFFSSCFVGLRKPTWLFMSSR